MPVGSLLAARAWARARPAMAVRSMTRRAYVAGTAAAIGLPTISAPGSLCRCSNHHWRIGVDRRTKTQCGGKKSGVVCHGPSIKTRRSQIAASTPAETLRGESPATTPSVCFMTNTPSRRWQDGDEASRLNGAHCSARVGRVFRRVLVAGSRGISVSRQQPICPSRLAPSPPNRT
jgi:hypothetical protein